MRNIAIFASGSGTNAENIIKYFSNKKSVRIRLVLSNRFQAMVLKRAQAHGIETLFFDQKEFYLTGKVTQYLIANKIDFIVLAGFLWLVPGDILSLFPDRIVNIHPALLPSYGGKGMYGDAVHKSVLANGDKESGVTIHYVNEHYDNGDIIFQARCKVEPGDTAISLASRIHILEYLHFPRVIEDLVMKLPDLELKGVEQA